MVALAAALTAAVSIYQFSLTSRVTGEFQNRSLQRLEAALLESAEAHALSLSTLTSDSLLEPLFFEDLDAVGNIVQSLLAKDQIIFANVYDAEGRVFAMDLTNCKPSALPRRPRSSKFWENPPPRWKCRTI